MTTEQIIALVLVSVDLVIVGAHKYDMLDGHEHWPWASKWVANISKVSAVIDMLASFAPVRFQMPIVHGLRKFEELKKQLNRESHPDDLPGVNG